MLISGRSLNHNKSNNLSSRNGDMAQDLIAQSKQAWTPRRLVVFNRRKLKKKDSNQLNFIQEQRAYTSQFLKQQQLIPVSQFNAEQEQETNNQYSMKNSSNHHKKQERINEKPNDTQLPTIQNNQNLINYQNNTNNPHNQTIQQKPNSPNLNYMKDQYDQMNEIPPGMLIQLGYGINLKKIDNNNEKSLHINEKYEKQDKQKKIQKKFERLEKQNSHHLKQTISKTDQEFLQNHATQRIPSTKKTEDTPKQNQFVKKMKTMVQQNQQKNQQNQENNNSGKSGRDYLRSSKRNMASQVIPPKNLSIYRSTAKGNGKNRNSVELIQNVDDADFDKMLYFFRYHIVSLIQNFGSKDDFDTGELPQTINESIYAESHIRLMKIVNTKTKYRYRCKIIYVNYAPLKTFFNIDAKQRYQALQQEKQQNLKKIELESDSDGSDYEPTVKAKKEKEYIAHAMLDMDYWKRKNVMCFCKLFLKQNMEFNFNLLKIFCQYFQGLGMKTKIFIIKGGYRRIREALEERGWYENETKNSPCFDLKWTCRSQDAYNVEPTDRQLVNHFRNNDVYTTKSGLSRNLRNLNQNKIDIDSFFPRCYDLYDQLDFDDFLEEYKYSQGISILITLLNTEKNKVLELYDEVRLKICISIVQIRLLSIKQLIGLIQNHNFVPLVTKEQWDIMIIPKHKLQNQQIYKDSNFKEINEKLNTSLNIQEKDKDESDLEYFNRIWTLAEKTLQNLKNNDPQFYLNGEKNIWIVKPALLSRGRGIKVYNSLNKIIDHLLAKDNQYIAQKYIERPLIIKNRKFDIRQWILVTSWNPLKIWSYDECYIRFCGQHYDTNDLENKYQHLTNNAVQSQKQSDNDIPGNMWDLNEFKSYLQSIAPDQEDVWTTKIQPRMEQIMIYSLQSCNQQVDEKPGAFEMFGYDFMIDEQLNPWILEINKSPTLESSTEITSRLCQSVQEDMIKVIVDYGFARKNRKNIDTGLFKCIYRQSQQ